MGGRYVSVRKFRSLSGEAPTSQRLCRSRYGDSLAGFLKAAGTLDELGYRFHGARSLLVAGRLAGGSAGTNGEIGQRMAGAAETLERLGARRTAAELRAAIQ